MPTKKKKPPKMDRKLISSEKHEIKSLAKKSGKSQKEVRAVKKMVGRSRVANEAVLIPSKAATKKVFEVKKIKSQCKKKSQFLQRPR